MKKLLLALAFFASFTGFAEAQCNGVFPNNTACGNISGSSGLPRPVPLNSFPANAPGGTTGQQQYNAGGGLFGGFTQSGDVTVNTATGVATIGAGIVTPSKLAANALPTYASRTAASGVDLSGFTGIQTLGYSTAGDGGAAIYVKVASQPFCGPFNNTAAFQDSAGNWWNISAPVEYNLKQFGAKMDSIYGVSGTVDTAAVQSALRCAALQTGSGIDAGGGAGKIVRVPAGWALIDATITVPNHVPVIGVCPICNGFDMSIGFSTSTHFFIGGDQYTQTDIAAAQSRGSAGNLTLNSASQWYRSGAIYSLYAVIGQICAASNNSGVNFTFTGTDRYGNAQTETIAGPTAGNCIVTTKFWLSITQLATNAATVGNVTAGFPQIATFGTRLQDLQLFSGNINATNFSTSINDTMTTTPTAGFSGNGMFYTNSIQHTAGLERVKIFAGDRMATFFERGVGGASLFTFRDVESYNSGNCTGCAVNNPQMYFNYSGLLSPMSDLVLASCGVACGASTGVQIDGGFVEARNVHCESGVNNCFANNIRNVNNGTIHLQMAFGGNTMAALLYIDPLAVASNTYASGLIPNGTTNTVNNRGALSGSVIVLPWTLY